MTVLKFLHPFHLHQPEFQHVQDPSSPVFSLFSADLQQISFKKYLEYIPVSVRNKWCKSCQNRNVHKMASSKGYESPFAIFLHAPGQISSPKCKKRNIQDQYSSICPSVHPSVRLFVHLSVRSTLCSTVCSTVRLTVRSTVHSTVRSTVRSTVCSTVLLSVRPSVRPSVRRLSVHPLVRLFVCQNRNFHKMASSKTY